MQKIIFRGAKHIATLASGRVKKKLFILIYHRVLDGPDFMRPGEVDKNSFEWQMALLAEYFNVLPLGEALENLNTDNLPPRAVCITFDDGYADNYTNALPILQKYGLAATFFIASAYLDGGRMWNDSIIETIRNIRHPQLDLSLINRGVLDISTEDKKREAAQQIILSIKHLNPEHRKAQTEIISSFALNLPQSLMMTSEQLRQLHQSGMDIGGHTLTHPILAKLTKDEARIEIISNKEALESILNSKLNYFAYPNGKPGQDYSDEHVGIVRDAGYLAALSTQWGVANKLSDLWQLPRFTPWDNDPLKFMLRMVYWFMN